MKMPPPNPEERINQTIQYYGFPPIKKGTPYSEFMATIADFIEYLHGYAKEYVSTDSIR